MSGRRTDVSTPALVPPPRTTFADALASAMDERQMTLTHLRRRLGERGHRVSLATLSYWRTGGRRPEHPASLDAVTEMESILGLPPGRLTSALGPSRRPGPALPTTEFSELADLSASADDVLRAMGMTADQQLLAEVTVQVALDVDADGNDAMATTRLLLRSLVDGAAHYPVGFVGIEGGERAELAWVRGATAGEELLHAGHGIQGWRLELDHPLQVGETTALEYAVHLPPTTHDYVEYHVARRVRELMIWVCFDPARKPRSAEAYGLGREPSTVELRVESSLTLVLPSFGPGSAGMRWTW